MSEPREINWSSPDGLRLSAREHGGADSSRLPVLCIPGLTRNSRDFEEIAPWIASLGRRVIAVDLRGRGRSDRDPDPRRYHLLTYASDLIALLDTLRIHRALFVGSSLGGLVTMTLALKHRDRIGGAILNDVGPVIAPAGLARIASYAGSPPTVTSWEEAVAYARQTGGVAFPKWTDAEWSRFVRRIYKEGPDGIPIFDCGPGVFRPMHPLAVWFLTQLIWHSLRRLGNGRPTLLVRGAISDVLDLATADRMRREAPDMQYVEVADVGHAPTLSEPAALEALARFFADAP